MATRTILLQQACEGAFEGPENPRRYYAAGTVIESPLSDEELPENARVVEDGYTPPADGVPEIRAFSEAVNSDVRVERACNALDPDDDTHWTEMGLPSMDAINEIAGPGQRITRGDVLAWNPEFRRPE